jgi:HD superfamily phosphodiesterase
MEKISLLGAVELHVKKLFDAYHEPHLLYHNLAHTQQVVAHAYEIGHHYRLDGDSLFIVVSAAWFHDTGYLPGNALGHEEKSVLLMREFLAKFTIEPAITEAIAACILATKIPGNPVSLLEKIVCDADTYHLGTDAFKQINQLVWQENESRLHTKPANQNAQTLSFLMAHRFYTGYCKTLLDPGKEKNIAWLEAQQQ